MKRIQFPHITLWAFIIGFVSGNQPMPYDGYSKESMRIPITEKCDAFFNAYSAYAGNFSHCELEHAQPFRMCQNCIEEYAMTGATYKDLVDDEALDQCSILFMKSDRVQIIPIMQKNIESVWTQAACAGCYVNLSINHETKDVNYDIPKSVKDFMEMYKALSSCLNTSLDFLETESTVMDKDSSGLCSLCMDNYTKLNDHYTDMFDQFGGDVCMDIVDRMNYTRLLWSYHFNCTNYSADPAPIIGITLVVGLAPILFYVILRLTGKEKKKKIVKQKRLCESVSRRSASSSWHHSLWRPAHYRDYQSLRST